MPASLEPESPPLSLFDSFRLDQRVSLVTGGTRNLGWNMALALAEAGSAVIVTSRDLDTATSAADVIRERCGVETLGLELEVSCFDSVAAMSAAAVAWKGGVDVLVNNAPGHLGGTPTDLFERSPASITEMVQGNVCGTLWCCRELGRHMRDRGRGSIINIASIAGMLGRDRRIYADHALSEQPVDYAASKAGLIGLTRDLAAKLGPHGVRVNAISPGGFDNGRIDRGFVSAYGAKTALGRMGRMDSDLKGAVVFLASAASAYITGQNLVVDGGFSIFH